MDESLSWTDRAYMVPGGVQSSDERKTGALEKGVMPPLTLLSRFGRDTEAPSWSSKHTAKKDLMYPVMLRSYVRLV